MAGKIILGLILALFGLFFIMGGWTLMQHVRLVYANEQSPGVVVRLKEVSWHPGGSGLDNIRSGKPEIYAIVQFRAHDGVVREFQSRQASYPSIYRVNDPVIVIYPRGNAERPMIYSKFELWFEPLVYLFIGSTPLLIWLLSWCSPRRNRT